MVSQKLNSVQLLRAIAAIMVMVGHAMAEAEHYFSTSFSLSNLPWTRGVDLFFVISGFIIVVSTYTRKGEPLSGASFLWRRFIRVAPLYYFFTTAMAVVLIVFPAGVKETQLELNQIITSYFFLPYERHDGRIAPVLSLGWTLNFEMFFYVVFAAFLSFGIPRAVLMMTALFSTLSIMGFVFDFEHPILRTWTNSIVMEFVFGALVGQYYVARGHVRQPQQALLPVAVMSFGFVLLVLGYWMESVPGGVMSDVPRFISSGIPATIVLIGAVMFVSPEIDKTIHPMFTALGDSSYSLYLSHRFVLRPVTLIWEKLLPMSPSFAVAYTVVVVVLGLIGGHICYLLIEKPFLRLASRKHVNTQGFLRSAYVEFVNSWRDLIRQK